MFKGSKFYALDDSGTIGRKGLIEIPEHSLKAFNTQKYGIFHSVNEFLEGVRKKENLIRLNAWYCDIDGGNKLETLHKISEAPVFPSKVVETANGYHLYWIIKGEAGEAMYAKIIEKIAAYFKGDKCRDTTRVLRMPGYYHWKNLEKPFMIREHTLIEEFANREYTEKEMIVGFKVSRYTLILEIFKNEVEKETNIIGQLINFDCRKGLEILSGTEAVNGDVYAFEDHENYTRIYVNKKASSAWIDANGKIGSHKRPGPTLFQWLKWYANMDISKVKEIATKYLGLEGQDNEK